MSFTKEQADLRSRQGQSDENYVRLGNNIVKAERNSFTVNEAYSWTPGQLSMGLDAFSSGDLVIKSENGSIPTVEEILLQIPEPVAEAVEKVLPELQEEINARQEDLADPETRKKLAEVIRGLMPRIPKEVALPVSGVLVALTVAACSRGDKGADIVLVSAPTQANTAEVADGGSDGQPPPEKVEATPIPTPIPEYSVNGTGGGFTEEDFVGDPIGLEKLRETDGTLVAFYTRTLSRDPTVDPGATAVEDYYFEVDGPLIGVADSLETFVDWNGKHGEDAEFVLGMEVVGEGERYSVGTVLFPEIATGALPIAVPLFGKDKSVVKGSGNNIIGLMVAKNRLDKPDFDSTDVKLFNSVANGCAVFVENGRLFKDLKELFIGSLKALTNSIDAKDPYTRGHSERVAFISRWIAEKIASDESLDREQIQKIYLAGLLHDIGKMGIDEAILRKKEKLTDEEFRYIRKHPSIGAGILSGIKQMREIVPGVLYHHERADGKGYPNGLSGVEIPLIGKIIALADSFDAMTSRRTYRKAMNIKEALEEIEKAIGSQFDEKVARAFLDSDIYRLCNIIQNGFSEAFGTGDFSEYETLAVGT